MPENEFTTPQRDPRGRQRIPIEDRFWRFVRKTETCWLWIGAKNSMGYGATCIDAHTTSAHRTSWILHYGPIPKQICILHRCDIPLCVNPVHLFLGTLKDNTQDAIKKGRFDPVKQNAKLTENEVRNIRKLHSQGMTLRKLETIFPVSDSCISDIILRKSWKHIP